LNEAQVSESPLADKNAKIDLCLAIVATLTQLVIRDQLEVGTWRKLIEAGEEINGANMLQ